MSGIILLISIVLLEMINRENDMAFLNLYQSRWEDKITATKIRWSSTLTKTLLLFVSELLTVISIVLFRVTIVICYNTMYHDTQML